MGTITISLNEQTEQQLRAIAKLKYSLKKGALAAVITEALKQWQKQLNQESINKSINFLEEGLKLGKIKTKRDDWHDR